MKPRELLQSLVVTGEVELHLLRVMSPACIPVDISPLDPVIVAEIFKSSEMISVPVRVRKLPPDSAWRDSEECGIFENEVVTLLLSLQSHGFAAG